MSIEWTCRPFAELSALQLYSVLRVRAEVFVLEQKCFYLDPDGLDLQTWHLLGHQGSELQAYARLLPPGLKQADAMIGRVLTSPTARSLGLGRPLMRQALLECARLWPGQAVSLSAQAHLQDFYASLGFEATSAVYVEDDIPHIDMRRQAPKPL